MLVEFGLEISKFSFLILLDFANEFDQITRSFNARLKLEKFAIVKLHKGLEGIQGELTKRVKIIIVLIINHTLEMAHQI